MEEKIFRKCLVIGIIVSFIGISIIPSVNSNIKKANRFYNFSNEFIFPDESVIELCFSFDIPNLEEIAFFNLNYTTINLQNLSNYGKPGSCASF